MRALFATQPGSGHWRPLLPLATALDAAGHEVAFATTPVACAAIAGYGFRCFPAGVDEWLVDAQPTPEGAPNRPAQAAAVWLDVFVDSRARRSLPDLLAVCHEWRPDLLVRELTEFAGCVAAERLGLPDAAVQVGAWRPDLHALVAPALDRLRAEVGLPPDPDLAASFRCLLLSPVPPSFQDPACPLPSTAHPMRYVPFDHGPGGEGRVPDWVEAIGDRPVVYATLGTTYNRTPGVIPAILAGLRDEPVDLVLTVGADQDPAALGEQPPHVRIERYVPQSLLFPHCDLVVCHGGFGTVLTALAHGLPLVVLPIAADQPDNARRGAECGVAVVVGPGARTPEAIRAATRAALGDARYRQNAERLRDEVRAMPGPEDAIGLLERLVASRAS